jgi:hypothetical protein
VLAGWGVHAFGDCTPELVGVGDEGQSHAFGDWLHGMVDRVVLLMDAVLDGWGELN